MHSRLNTILFAIIILASCTEKSSDGSKVTFLVTGNVRGQLDPCG